MSGISNQSAWTSANNDYNATEFAVQQLLARVRTAALVKVISCTSAGTLAPAGVVNVQPLVNAMDAFGYGSPHGVLGNLLYLRNQGGNSAVIMDPAANDMGVALICDRDTSRVRATKAPALPGSWRRFNLLDGIYIGGVLNAQPTQYLQFMGNQAALNAVTALLLQIAGSAVVSLTSSGVSVTGTLSTTQALSAGNGASGSFTAGSVTVTVHNGIVTGIS